LLQWQESILNSENSNPPSESQIVAQRAYLGMVYGAVLLDSPTAGNVTAWIRFKNSGATPAYKVIGWMLFYRMPSAANPFNDVRKASNESVVSPGGNSNLSGTIPITSAQLRAIETKTESFFVWC
jgi:hypothetical protein